MLVDWREQSSSEGLRDWVEWRVMFIGGICGYIKRLSVALGAGEMFSTGQP